MIIQLFLRYPLMAIVFHIALGFLAQSQPLVLSVYYVGITLLALVEIAATQDRAQLAGYYGLYITGMEILSRMAQASVFWEFGKYATLAVFALGSFWATKQQQRPYLLLAYFVLLLPGIAVTAIYAGIGENRILDLTSQYLSGPAAMVAAGWYFYRCPLPKTALPYLLRAGIMPAVAVVTLLFLGKSLSEIDFISGSNFDASGGFGPNQVSSALGWSIVLVILGMLFQSSATGYVLLDIILLLLLVFRGLLTFSRGGMMGAFGAIGVSMLVLFLISSDYRTRMKRLLPRVAAALALLVLVAYVANNITGNYLLYRYQGKSTSEVIIGKSEEEKEYFSGREDILSGELKIFAENPLLGIGLGRGTIYREGEFNSDAVASHTEFTRMLGEHGLLGLLAIAFAFILLPFQHFLRLRDDDTRQWMLTFLILSMFTLVHSGMRLALPSVAFGLAFIFIVPAGKKTRP